MLPGPVGCTPHRRPCNAGGSAGCLCAHQTSLNARYRRAATACGHFPNEQAALKRIYLATLALDPSGHGRKRWNNKWKAALNEFDQLFDGRLTAGRV